MAKVEYMESKSLDAFVRFRCKEEEKVAWAAAAAGKPLSTWMRNVANSALVEGGVAGGADAASASSVAKPPSASAGGEAAIGALPEQGEPAVLASPALTEEKEPVLGEMVVGCEDHRDKPKAWCVNCQRERGHA